MSEGMRALLILSLSLEMGRLGLDVQIEWVARVEKARQDVYPSTTTYTRFHGLSWIVSNVGINGSHAHRNGVSQSPTTCSFHFTQSKT